MCSGKRSFMRIISYIKVFKRKVFIKFFLDSRNAKKQIHELQVTDKQFAKHKLTGVINLTESQSIFYYLRLGINFYIVKADVYQNIEKGQVVNVHLSAQSKILLKIQPVGMHP